MKRRALITGITGQDGSYLAEFLLDQGYEVLGLLRRSSTVNFERISHIQDRLTLVSGDLLDEMSLVSALREHRPTEIYNLAAQSFVPTSWTQPVFTGEVTALGVTRLLDAIRVADPDIRFYQASSSEMFGKVREVPQTRDDAVLPPQPVRRCQGVRPLDHRQLPRELRPARDVWHPVQSRVATTGAGVLDAQDRQRRGSDQARPRRTSFGLGTSRRAATGAGRQTTCRRCG